jgi:hypothetical protein
VITSTRRIAEETECRKIIRESTGGEIALPRIPLREFAAVGGLISCGISITGAYPLGIAIFSLFCYFPCGNKTALSPPRKPRSARVN